MNNQVIPVLRIIGLALQGIHRLKYQKEDRCYSLIFFALESENFEIFDLKKLTLVSHLHEPL